MDSKTKLYVFAKKEVALIFIFMILIAITSFVTGVKIGKEYGLVHDKVTPEDQKKVIELLSKNEEDLEAIKTNPEAHVVLSEEIDKKLEEKISEDFGVKPHDEKDVAEKAVVLPIAPNMSTEKSHNEASHPKPKEDKMSGKFTIQLGSYRTLKEAEEFSEGFRTRGYDTIINQADIKGKGIYYRVSIGAFTDKKEAEFYISEQRSLFVGKDYPIVKMP